MRETALKRTMSRRGIGMLLTLFLCLLALILNVTQAGAMGQRTAKLNALGTGVMGVQVFVEPDAGEQVILDAINNAQRSVYVELYLLTDTNVVNALKNVASNGLDVRVMLEHHPYGGGSPDNTLQALRDSGAQAQYTNPDFALTHEKAMIIDGQTAYIMTCNLSKSALGGSSSTKNREYGIVDSNASDVKAATDIFNADWNRTAYTPSNDNIVLSPVNARTDFSALIGSAKTSLSIEAEEMQDSSIEQALINAVQRGVTVQVILPYNDSGNTSGITTIQQGGVTVKEDKKLYMHAKIILVDGKEAFVGSENISTYSLDKNRELGILVADTSVLATLKSTFNQDWSASVAA